MELLAHFFQYLLIIIEILLIITAETLGMADINFPPQKFNARNFNPRPEKKPTGLPLPGRANLFGGHSNIDWSSVEQSKILEFIEIIQTNKTFRDELCNNSPWRNIELTSFNYTFTPSSFIRYKDQASSGQFIAKSLKDIFNVTRNITFTSLNDDHMKAVTSVLKTILEEDDNLAGGGIAFASKFFPYIYKTNKGQTKGPLDISTVYNFTLAKFYTAHPGTKPSGSNDRTSGLKDSGIFEDAFWDQPNYDCRHLRRWTVGISFPFYGYRNGGAKTLKGVVLLDIDLNQTSVNQCGGSDTIFSGSHKCLPESTQCQYAPGRGFKPGNYECHCKPGFYFPVLNATQKFFYGTQIERHFLQSMRNGSNMSSTFEEYQCLPCLQGCTDCKDDSPCFVEYNILMRGIPLGIQSFCMTITLVLGIVVLRFRKCKVMVIGMWCLLEIIFLGALFLYATVVIQYFEPSTTTCLIVPWLREVGFAVLYGALVLKIYKLLADFQSRKAHRVYVRDKDLLKYLLCIVIVVIGYMAAWTAVNIDQVQEGKSLVDTGVTSEGALNYFVCKTGWWDYSTEAAEVLFLVFGIYLCYRVRAAPSDYSEGTYISAAICYECFISTVFYILRHIYWLELDPDYLFLMYFLRCQLTVSVTLVLVFGPKLWYAHRPPDERHIRNRAYSSSDVPDNMAPETMKLNVGISSNGDVDVGDVSLADMDPEDIRAELKRLYTQLQIYKTRSMRKDNPHISKRRGGRKQTHRRFSLQAFHHKHRHHHEHEHEHEMSKTPEESTNSAEGLPMPIEMSVTKCEEMNENKPSTTVSFKMCHGHK